MSGHTNNQKGIPLGKVSGKFTGETGIDPRAMGRELVQAIKDQEAQKEIDITIDQQMNAEPQPDRQGLASIGEGLFKIQNLVGKFFPERMEPAVEKLSFDELFPGLSQPIKAGVVTGQIIGTQPIFVGAGGIFPTGIVQARKRALGRAAAAKLKAQKDFFDAIKPTKTPKQYTQFVDKLLFDGIGEVIRMIDGDFTKIESNPEIALSYQRFIANNEFLRNSTVELDADARQTIVDDLDPNIYVPDQALENALSIRKGWIPGRPEEDQGFNPFTQDVGVIGTRMRSFKSVGAILTTDYFKTIEPDISTFITDKIKREGIDITKPFGVKFIATLKKEFLTDSKFNQILDNLFADNVSGRDLGNIGIDRPQLKRLIEPMFDKLLGTTLTSLRTASLSGAGRSKIPDSFFIPQRNAQNDLNQKVFNSLVKKIDQGIPIEQGDWQTIQDSQKNFKILGRKVFKGTNDIANLTPDQARIKTLRADYSPLMLGFAKTKANFDLANGLKFNKNTGLLEQGSIASEFVAGTLINMVSIPWGKAGESGAYTRQDIEDNPSLLGSSVNKIRLVYAIGRPLNKQGKNEVNNFLSRAGMTGEDASAAFNEAMKRANVSDDKKADFVIFELDLSNDSERAQMELLVGTEFRKAFFATGKGEIEAPEDDFTFSLTDDGEELPEQKSSLLF